MRPFIQKISKEEMKENTKKLLKDYEYKFIENEGELLYIKLKNEKERNEVASILCKFKFSKKVSTPRVL